MSEAGFTKGPWQRSGVRVWLGTEDCLQVGPDGFSIAFLPIGSRPKDQAGAIADANLIAAAPDLLEALQGMVSIQDSVTQGQEADLRAEWLPKARAALAKALGR